MDGGESYRRRAAASRLTSEADVAAQPTTSSDNINRQNTDNIEEGNAS